MTTIGQNWNFMRLLRLGMGIWLVYSAFADHQPLLGLLGGLFALQSVLNVGCCGSGGCATSTIRQKNIYSTSDTTHYEEVK